MSQITDAAQALAGLLRAAEADDIPLPSSAEALTYAIDSEHYPDIAENRGGISLLVRSFDDLIEWSLWLDEPVDDTADEYCGKIHCHVRGMAGPVPVRVTALVAPESLAVTR